MEKMCRIANVHQESSVKADSPDQIVGRYIMEFDETEFEIEILNDGSVVHDMGELVEKGIEFL